MADASDQQSTPWTRRVRSAVLLVVLVAGLGVAAAGLTGVVIVVGGSLVDQALG